MKSSFNKGMLMCKDLGIEPTYDNPGHWPVSDNVGFTVALQLLRSSQLKGDYREDSQEFDTIRSLCTIFSHTHEILANVASL